jgi:hypothetical protein
MAGHRKPQQLPPSVAHFFCGPRDRRATSARQDNPHLAANQVRCHLRKSIGLTFRPFVNDLHGPTCDKAAFGQALERRGDEGRPLGRRRALEQSDHRHGRVLRAEDVLSLFRKRYLVSVSRGKELNRF